MKQTVSTQNFGEITYEESMWTGKKKLFINNKKATKTSRNTFTTEDGLTCYISGNFLTGAKLIIGEETILLSATAKKYEVALSMIPFIFIMVWGNSVALVNIFPVVGGAIGGAISGLFGMTNLVVIKNLKNVWLKIFVSFAMFATTVVICFLVALAFLSAIN